MDKIIYFFRCSTQVAQQLKIFIKLAVLYAEACNEWYAHLRGLASIGNTEASKPGRAVGDTVRFYQPGNQTQTSGPEGMQLRSLRKLRFVLQTAECPPDLPFTSLGCCIMMVKLWNRRSEDIGIVYVSCNSKSRNAFLNFSNILE